jgi:hypothetical protein
LDGQFVRQACVAGVALFVTCMAANLARADEAGDLEKAYGPYVAHKYGEAEARLRALLDPKTGLTDPDRRADARMYLGAVLLAEGKRPEAMAELSQLLLDKPDYQADPLRVSVDALDALEDARSQLRSQLTASKIEERAAAARERAAARQATLERLASEELVIEHHSRWIALLPFGVGQFQNRENALGWTFLSGEALLAAGSAVGSALTLYNESKANDALVRSEVARSGGYHDRAFSDAIAADLFAGSFAVLAIAGIAHAEITFSPEQLVEVRRRPLPPLSLAPVLGPGDIGIFGRF